MAPRRKIFAAMLETEAKRIEDEGDWGHPPPAGTVKLRCIDCGLWFSSREGRVTCPICKPTDG